MKKSDDQLWQIIDTIPTLAWSARPDGSAIKAFCETDFTEDLKKIDVPTLILHGDDDQIVPIADSALLSAKLVKGSTRKVYPGLPHGMCTTNPDRSTQICSRSLGLNKRT